MQPKKEEDQEMKVEELSTFEGNQQNTEVDKAEPTPEISPSVLTDFELIAQKELTQLDEEVIEFSCHQWEIADWSELPDRVQGPIFEVGGHRWNVLLFPKGNGVPDYTSIYLEYTDAKTGPPDNYACSQFVICLSKPSDPTQMFTHSAQHRFCADESDWGFTRFIDHRTLASEKGCLEDNSLRITTIIKVIKDPTGVLWHNFHNYDSKKMTGHVGLKNQGATCYMNSLFQSLYCTNYFRKAVFQIPTEHDEPTNSVALALQRMFYNLQSLNTPVGTTELTKSFGWNSLEAFRQHDVQEFNRVLQDNLEEKMKGTPADGAIKKLFLGKMKSYIKCINVNYESSRSEDYYDIQLNVKGCENLEQSFKDYIAEETLEGDNKYMAEGYGLQDAKKGVIFESFPPVLHLQLKRFEYDIMRDMMVKINDRHEFPLSIDLDPYLSESADHSVSHEYMLHGVLVHSGDLSGGHYFAFVKPTTEDRWLKFDDDRVVPSTLKEVLEENFGGEERNTNNQTKPNDWAYKRVTNAYMLVYIRKSMLDEILAPVTPEDIPQHLIQRLEKERLEKEIKKREREEEHLYMKAMIVTDEAFINNYDLDFINFNELNGPGRKLMTILKTQTFGEFKHTLSKDLGLPVNHIRPWILVNRQNKTIRPDAPIPDEDLVNTVDDVRVRHLATHNALRLYIETATTFDTENNPIFPPYPTTNNSKILVFIKLFDPFKQEVHGIGKLYVSKLDKVGSILESLNKMAEFEPETPITLYEEIKPEMVESMNLEKTFAASEIQDGDIICIEKKLTEEMSQELKSQGLRETVAEYMDFLYNKRVVRFYSIDNNPEMEVDVTLLRSMKLKDITEALAKEINADADKILVYLPSNKNERKPIKRFPDSTLGDIERTAQMNDFKITRLVYDVLDISVSEFENTRKIGLTWFTPTLSDGTYEEFLVPKQNCINDLIIQLSQRGATFQSENGTRQIRVWEAFNNKFKCELALSDSISKVSENINAQLYIEEVPKEEESVPIDERFFITVFHYQRDISRTHSVPFKFLVIKDEPFSETKLRLQQRTGLSDSDWNKVKICLVSNYLTTPIDEDDYKLSDHNFDQDDALGLDHVDKTGRVNRNPMEQGLTIRG